MGLRPGAPRGSRCRSPQAPSLGTGTPGGCCFACIGGTISPSGAGTVGLAFAEGRVVRSERLEDLTDVV